MEASELRSLLVDAASEVIAHAELQRPVWVTCFADTGDAGLVAAFGLKNGSVTEFNLTRPAYLKTVDEPSMVCRMVVEDEAGESLKAVVRGKSWQLAKR